MSSRSPMPPIGSIAYGRSGLPCLVVECYPERITLQLPDRSRIVVNPSAILRWENPPKLQLESNEEISIVSIAPNNKLLESLSRETCEEIDNPPEFRSPIDRPSKVSIAPASIDRNIDRPETSAGQMFEKSQIDEIDIFAPLSGQRNFEILKPGDRVVIKNLIECLKRYPRMSLDLQCAVYHVERVREDSTAIVTSKSHISFRLPIDWLGVLP